MFPSLTYTRDMGWCLWELDTARNTQNCRSDHSFDGSQVIAPDGNHVADVGDDGALQVWDRSFHVWDGTQRGQVPGDAGSLWNVVWSPDSSCVLFNSIDGVHMLRIATDALTICVTRVDTASLTWSPDGQLFAFSVWEEGVFVSDLEGHRHQLVSGYVGDMDWSPDSTEIAYSIPSKGIHCVAIANGQNRQLTDHPEDTDPVWSPDGRIIAYSRRFPGELRAVLVDGSDTTVLRDDRVEHVRWSPDSTRLAYTSCGRYYSGTAVAVIDLTSSERQLIIGGGSQPVWVDNEQLVWLRWMGENGICY